MPPIPEIHCISSSSDVSKDENAIRPLPFLLVYRRTYFVVERLGLTESRALMRRLSRRAESRALMSYARRAAIAAAVALACVDACCPNGCSGRGQCAKGNFCRCTCNEGWSGPDCGSRMCPLGNAWADVASSVDTAHAPVECSAAGSCDAISGVCMYDCSCRECCVS